MATEFAERDEVGFRSLLGAVEALDRRITSNLTHRALQPPRQPDTAWRGDHKFGAVAQGGFSADEIFATLSQTGDLSCQF